MEIYRIFVLLRMQYDLIEKAKDKELLSLVIDNNSKEDTIALALDGNMNSKIEIITLYMIKTISLYDPSVDIAKVTFLFSTLLNIELLPITIVLKEYKIENVKELADAVFLEMDFNRVDVMMLVSYVLGRK